MLESVLPYGWTRLGEMIDSPSTLFGDDITLAFDWCLVGVQPTFAASITQLRGEDVKVFFLLDFCVGVGPSLWMDAAQRND